MQYITTVFASTYGSGTYDSSTYNGASSTGSNASTGVGTSRGGVLTNTGFDVLLAATLACAIVFMALAVRFWRRPAREVASAAGPVSDEDQEANSSR